MYSERAISTLRRVCQVLRQTNSAFSDLKKLSTADLAIGLEPMALAGSIVAIAVAAHPLPGSGCLHPREGTP